MKFLSIPNTQVYQVQTQILIKDLSPIVPSTGCILLRPRPMFWAWSEPGLSFYYIYPLLHTYTIQTYPVMTQKEFNVLIKKKKKKQSNPYC